MNNLFNDLKNKVGVITGGAGVIGTALAHALGSAGVKTAILDIDLDKAMNNAEKLSSETGTKITGIQANVLDRESLEKAYNQVIKELGPVDFLINGAGGNTPEATTKLEELTDETVSELENSFFGLSLEGFEKVFALNFLGTVLPVKVFARDMVKRKQGVILNISSMNSFKPLTRIPAYSAAKASVNNFTQWLAVHLAKVGIRVNAIAPGFFLTDQNRFLVMDKKTGDYSPRGKKIIANTPMGKFGHPEDIQGTALFLLSEMSGFITGIILPVDGGYSAFGGV
ncbi:MAG: SDR family oxidoreductase [Bacteroidetes bacterium]|nr:SDR family oxidoreductase [Bacteroidota bacterium]